MANKVLPSFSLNDNHLVIYFTFLNNSDIMFVEKGVFRLIWMLNLKAIKAKLLTFTIFTLNFGFLILAHRAIYEKWFIISRQKTNSPLQNKFLNLMIDLSNEPLMIPVLSFVFFLNAFWHFGVTSLVLFFDFCFHSDEVIDSR